LWPHIGFMGKVMTISAGLIAGCVYTLGLTTVALPAHTLDIPGIESPGHAVGLLDRSDVVEYRGLGTTTNNTQGEVGQHDFA
jgi:hypothetical protein